MLPSSIEGLPSVWDSDQPDQPNIKANQNDATIANMQQCSTDTSNSIEFDEVCMDLTGTKSDDEQFAVEYLINSDKENNNGNEKFDLQDYNQVTKKAITYETDVSVLKKKITPELRTVKKLKKIHQQISHESSKREMKEELQEIRKKILKKELEIKENQFFAELEINAERLKTTKVESEMRLLQKQIKAAKLKKITNVVINI
ncbi:uncharacterized protein LOC105201294 [Solenopsis invicta]|uniref:uncharacterized protein LOC105201294 n=1 Tax=Solenopsis invicta TaxID=13686 RepID=UPI000595BCFB|nr:uncharacterized protein LOC105201294 [Solenopsis invicta]